MVKPWLVPLVEDITGPNQADKIFFAGIDRGLIEEGVDLFEELNISSETYVNAGFWVLRNVPEVANQMEAVIKRLQKNPDLPYFEQTALNMEFSLKFKGYLSARFEKWLHWECKPWTINCHGPNPDITAEAGLALDKAYSKWLSASTFPSLVNCSQIEG
jgi:hypothetical protein